MEGWFPGSEREKNADRPLGDGRKVERMVTIVRIGIIINTLTFSVLPAVSSSEWSLQSCMAVVSSWHHCFLLVVPPGRPSC